MKCLSEANARLILSWYLARGGAQIAKQLRGICLPSDLGRWEQALSVLDATAQVLDEYVRNVPSPAEPPAH